MLRLGDVVVQAAIKLKADRPVAFPLGKRQRDEHSSSSSTWQGSIFMKAKHPWLTADCVVFDADGRLLLIRRKHPPFLGKYALPGGYVEYGETTEHAAARELAEETGLAAVDLSLIGVYSDPHRDPRGHVVSIAYRVAVASYDLCAGDDAADAAFVANWQDLDLAFDHRKIVDDAARKCRP
jgi:8-oxo-dGTP diphosphatase